MASNDPFFDPDLAALEMQQPTFDPDLSLLSEQYYDPDLQAFSNLEQINREPTTIVAKAFDLLSRLRYGVLKFADAVDSDAAVTFTDALKMAGSEVINPKDRLEFSDFVDRRNPAMEQQSPIAYQLINFIGNTVTDPISYLGWSGKALNAAGKAALTTEMEFAKKSVKALTEQFKTLKTAELFSPKQISRAVTQANPVLAQSAENLSYAAKNISKTMLGELPEDMLDALATNPRFRKFLEPKFAYLQAHPKDMKTILEGQFLKDFDFRGTAWDLIKDIPEYFNQGALKFAGIPVVPNEVFKAIGKITGISRLTKAISESEKIENIMGLVNRYQGFDPALKELSLESHVQLHGLKEEARSKVQQIYDAAEKLQYKLTPEAREKLARAMTAVGDRGGELYTLLRKTQKMTKAEAARKVSLEAENIRNKIFAEFKLTPEEREITAALYRGYNEVNHILQRAGVLKYAIPNYSPRIYDNIKSPVNFMDDIPEIRNPFVAAAEPRKYATVDEAIKEGKNPIFDAMLLYTNRYAEARRLEIMKNYKDGLLKAFPDGVPKKYQKDFRFIGEGDYGAGLTDGMRTGLELYDKVTNVFRRFATTMRVAFGPKQFIANTMQQIAGVGVRGGKAFDPRGLYDAGMALLLDSRTIQKDPALAARLSASIIKNDFGDVETIGDLVSQMKAGGLLSGRNVSGIESITKSIGRELDIEMAQRGLNSEGPWRGLYSAFKQATNYLNYPAQIENFSKAAMYINLRRMGWGNKEAIGKTFESLFDYARGLSQFERRFARRIVPFYSFQRFAYPLIAKTLATNPRRITIPQEAVSNFFDVFGRLSEGEDISPAERYALPDYLLDQHFNGYDDERKAIFRNWQNISPIEVMDFVQLDQNGDMDFPKTLQRVFLAQIAPVLKIPFEIAVRKNFFTDKSIDPTVNRTAGRIGDVDPNRVLGNIMSMLGGRYAGIPGLALGQLAAQGMPNNVQDFALKALGWEEAIDPKTGNRQVYVNPYTSMIASELFPTFGQAIRLARNRPAIDNWLDLLAGVSTQRIDPEVALERKFKSDQYQIQNLTKAFKDALEEQRLSEAEKRKIELETLIQRLEMEYGLYNQAIGVSE